MGKLEAVNFDIRSNNDSRFLDHLVGEANKYNPPFVERHPCQALFTCSGIHSPRTKQD